MPGCSRVFTCMSTTARPDQTNDVTYRVLEAVAECHDIDVLDIEEPLQETVDGDCLSKLWGPKARSSDGVQGELTFHFYDCRVTVRSDGSVEATLQ